LPRRRFHLRAAEVYFDIGTCPADLRVYVDRSPTVKIATRHDAELRGRPVLSNDSVFENVGVVGRRNAAWLSVM